MKQNADFQRYAIQYRNPQGTQWNDYWWRSTLAAAMSWMDKVTERNPYHYRFRVFDSVTHKIYEPIALEET